jgi:hypothetical protein
MYAPKPKKKRENAVLWWLEQTIGRSQFKTSTGKSHATLSVNNIFISVSNAVCVMLRMDLRKGTRFRDTHHSSQILLKIFRAFYFRNFKQCMLISKYYLIFLPNICGIWYRSFLE